jgi:glycosyltransferase involved in cell wall biosynthesis
MSMSGGNTRTSSSTDQRTHIMQVTFGMVIGGLERVVMELCRHVDPSLYRLSICCIGERGPLADVMEAEGVEVIVCQNQSRAAKYMRGLELAKLFRDHRVDLIHSHHTPALIDSTIGARLTRRPLVHTDHGKLYPTSWRWRMLEQTASRFAARVVAVSECSRRDLVERQGIASGKVDVIYNGLDLKPPRSAPLDSLRRELGASPSDFIIGTAARLEEQKGLELLLDAARQALQVEPRLRIVIVGGGTREAALREYAQSLGIESRVLITGYRIDAVTLMSAFDCFVQTSHWEAMPMALLEAMALQKPVIATAVGGVPEVVKDGQTGFLLQGREPAVLADLIVGMVRDETAARAMGEAGRQRYRDQFTSERMIARYEDLYGRVLRHRLRPAA